MSANTKAISDDILKAAWDAAGHVYSPDDSPSSHSYVRDIIAKAIHDAVMAERERNRWQPIETAPKTGRFLALAAGHTERQSWEDPATIITINSFEGPMICEGFESGKGYIDEFGEQYGPDGRVDDAEDLTAADDILRLTHWQPLPSAPKAEG